MQVGVEKPTGVTAATTFRYGNVEIKDQDMEKTEADNVGNE